MNKITVEIALNVRQYGGFGISRERVRIQGKQGDGNVRAIVARLLNGGDDYTLSGTETAYLNAVRIHPETKARERETFLASIEGGKVKIDLPPWVAKNPGRVFAEFLIEDGPLSVRTETFLIENGEAVRETADIGDDADVRTLTDLIEEARVLLESITEGTASLPEITAADDGKIIQAKNSAWRVQHPELGEESVHILTNVEIEALLSNSV